MKFKTIAFLLAMLLLALTGCSNPSPKGNDSRISSFSEGSQSSSDSEVSAAKGIKVAESTPESMQSITPEKQEETAKNPASSQQPQTASDKTQTTTEPPKQTDKTEKPASQPTPSQAESKQTESKKPEPSSKPEPPKEKDPYAYPFDIEKIKADLIKYGEETLGMKHITEWAYDTLNENGNIIHVKESITPENSSWWGGYILSKGEYANPSKDKRQLYEYLKHDQEEFQMTSFTIYVKPLSDGAYQIYVLR